MSTSSVSGASSPAGTHYVQIVAGGRTIWVKKRLFARPAQVIEIMARHEVVIPDKKAIDRLVTKAADLTEFPVQRILERFGWNDDAYLLRDGTVVCAADDVVGLDAELQVMQHLVAGSLEDWFTHVVKPLRHNALGLFALALPFAAPLLKFVDLGFNPAFELVGAQGIGKTTLQKMSLSVCGPWTRPGGQGLWSAHLKAKGDVQTVMAAFADHLLVLDSRDSYGLGTTFAERRKAFRANAVGMTDSAGGRLCVFSSSNQPLAVWLGGEEAVATTLHRTLTIQLDPVRELGVFDELPNGYPSAGDLANDLAIAAGRYHGQALRTFLGALVAEAQADPIELVRAIRFHMDAFRRKARSDVSDGPSRQRADAFALVYAAAALARRFGALPGGSRVSLGRYRHAVTAAYRLHLKSLVSVEQIRTTLLAAASQMALLCTEETTEEELNGATLLVKRARRGDELWIKEQELERLVPGFIDHCRDPEFTALFKPDKDGHLKPKRRHNHVKLGRVAVFKLPAGWDRGGSLFEE